MQEYKVTSWDALTRRDTKIVFRPEDATSLAWSMAYTRLEANGKIDSDAAWRVYRAIAAIGNDVDYVSIPLLYNDFVTITKVGAT